MYRNIIVAVYSFFCIVSSSLYAAASSDSAEIDKSVVPVESAEIFGLHINNLSRVKLENQLQSMGLESYPSYKSGVISYSLGADGILGLKSLTLRFNRSGYINDALMEGVVQSRQKRQALGQVLEKKYGKPTIGFIADGIGRAKWQFKDRTTIEFHNTTFDVSLLYVDEQPAVISNSGKIDVEALAKKK